MAEQQKQTRMDCIIVGGCANGLLLRQINANAQHIELKRPDYIKPIQQASQDVPDVHHIRDVYEVHPIGFQNTDEKGVHLFGLGVIDGQSLTWGFSQLVKSHIEATTMKLRAANLLKTN